MFGSRFYIFMGGLIVAATALLAASTIGCNEPISLGIVEGDKPTVASKVPSASQPAWDMFMASCLSPSARGYDERRIANSCAHIADLAVVERRARLATTRSDLNDEVHGSYRPGGDGGQPVTPEDVLRIARECLQNGTHRYSNHFFDQMAKRGVAVPDVKKAIRTATGAVQQDNGSWRITGGKDTEGDDLVLAVSVVDERITLITPLDSNGE